MEFSNSIHNQAVQNHFISNIVEATAQQFLALRPDQSLTDTIVYLQDCKKIQDIAKKKLEKLKEYNINSQEIVDQLQSYSSCFTNKTIEELHKVNDNYTVYRVPNPSGTSICGICGYKEEDSSTFTLVNEKKDLQKNRINFQKINIHAIVAHNNFYYAGKIGSREGYEISVFGASNILDLIKKHH